MRVHDHGLRARFRERTWRGGRRSCLGTKGGGTGGEGQERRTSLWRAYYPQFLAFTFFSAPPSHRMQCLEGCPWRLGSDADLSLFASPAAAAGGPAEALAGAE